MVSKKFQPEIQRNRFRSNWVAASSLSNRSAIEVTSKGTKFTVALISCSVILALGVFFTSVSTQTAERSIGSTFSGDSSNSNPPPDRLIAAPTEGPCDINGLTRQLTAHAKSDGIDSFTKTDSELLGGLRVEKYSCPAGNRDVNFAAQWQEVDSIWKLKKISQLPQR